MPSGDAKRFWSTPWGRCLQWVISFAVMIAALLWPAFWNGFPLVFYDSGGYLTRPFEGSLAFGRSALYGRFLAFGIPSNFWLVALTQAALTAWLLTLVLRVHGISWRPWTPVALVVTLAIATSLPWYASQLMPDIFLPAAVLALYLVAFHWANLRLGEVIFLGVAVVLAMASHMAFLLLCIGLAAAIGVLRAFASRARLLRPRLRVPVAVVAIGILAVPISNLAVTGHFAFTPGGANFVFARLIDDGIATRYLADKCPDASLRLCTYRNDMPPTGDEWLWGRSPLFGALGGPQGFEDEARRIALETLMLYPGDHLRLAATNTLRQFLLLKTGDGLSGRMDHTDDALRTYAPTTFDAYESARQQQGILEFEWINLIHVPVALLCLIALPVLIGLGFVSSVRPAEATFALFVLLALIGNAAICGLLSLPSDRYQNRLVPLAPLAVAIAVLRGRPRVLAEDPTNGSSANS